MKPSKLVRYLHSKHKNLTHKKPFAIGETLIKPCILVVTKAILGLPAMEKIEDLSLSNNTIQRITNDMVTDIEEQVIESIRKLIYFAIQLDESTDIDGIISGRNSFVVLIYQDELLAQINLVLFINILNQMH